jgi:hypothetical protein
MPGTRKSFILSRVQSGKARATVGTPSESPEPIELLPRRDDYLAIPEEQFTDLTSMLTMVDSQMFYSS